MLHGSQRASDADDESGTISAVRQWIHTSSCHAFAAHQRLTMQQFENGTGLFLTNFI
jgi:C1A family cysteine protease